MAGGPGRAVTAKHLSGISSEDAVSGKSEEQGRQALRIRVGNKEPGVNVLRWKTSRGECGSVSARGPVGDTQHVENHIGGVCLSSLIHLGRHRRTAPPRKSPRPLYNVVYDNRKATSWKSRGRERTGWGRGGGGLLLDKKLGVPQPKSRESGGFGQNHYQKMEGGQKPFTVNSILQSQFGTRSSLSFLFLFFISVSITTCCTLARF